MDKVTERQSRLQRAYRQLFLTPKGDVPSGYQQVVLADIMRFCSMDKVPLATNNGAVDAYATIYRLGRFEVGQRVQNMLHLPQRDIIVITNGDENFI